MENSRRSAKSADPVVAALRCEAWRARPILVAYSGGLDSSVLLHAAAEAFDRGDLVAVHVHHGLQAQADDWASKCAAQAADLGVAFRCERIAARPAPGVSIESWARTQRYETLARVARACGAATVFTAHHADDQVETVLMRIARGTGTDGLSAMHAERPLLGGLLQVSLVRPLLALPRAELHAYAQRNALRWVEDPSNRDVRLLRSALRTRVLPALDAVAPAFRANLLRTVAHVAAAGEALRERARADLARAAAAAPHGVRPADRAGGRPAAGAGEARAPARLDRQALVALDPDRQGAVLREWCLQLGLRTPSEARLREMLRQLVDGQGAYGRVEHEEHAWVRYRDAIEVRPLAAEPAHLALDGDREAGPTLLRWRGEACIPLAGTGGALWVRSAAALSTRGEAPCSSSPSRSPGFPADWLRAQVLEIGPCALSARLRLSPAGSSRDLKRRYQERGIPAPLRAHLPVIRVGGAILYAAGLGVDRSPHWPADPQGVVLDWCPDDPSDPRAAFCPPARL